MDKLDEIIEKIHQTFETRTKARDEALKQARLLTRYCANAIRAVHRNEHELALEHLADARELAELVLYSLTSHSNLGIGKDIKPAPLEITSRQLVWLPFYEKGIYLRDALLNVGILRCKIHSPKLD